jgi:hypothetical protein
MAMSNVRFIEGSSIVKTGFYTRQTLIRAIQKNSGLEYKEARSRANELYNKSKINLHDAYELKDGILHKKE